MMTHLKDWAREEDTSYAKAKYEKEGFDYEVAKAKDEQNKKTMNGYLQFLEAMLKSETSFYEGNLINPNSNE